MMSAIGGEVIDRHELPRNIMHIVGRLLDHLDVAKIGRVTWALLPICITGVVYPRLHV